MGRRTRRRGRSRRANPLSRIVTATKSGGYGTTLWHHELDCGHIFSSRRRLPDGKQLDCTTCASIQAEIAALEQLPAVVDWTPEPITPEVTDFEPPLSTEAAALERAAQLRAALAGRLGLPLETVEIAVDGPRIVGARILLDLQALQRLVDGLT